MNSLNLSAKSEFLTNFQQKAVKNGFELVAAGLIINNGRFFVQKRMPDRKLFPGCWDIAGGHVEQGETIYSALEREIFEETGWTLKKIICIAHIFDWQAPNSPIPKREIDFIVEIEGDLNNPRIETEKFSEFRWIGKDETEILKENRQNGDFVIYEIVKKAFEILS